MDKNSYKFNPALVLGVGLFPLLIVATDFKSALIYAGLIFMMIMLTTMIVGAFKLIIPNRVRYICYTLCMLGIIYFLDSVFFELFSKNYSSTHSLIAFIFASSVILFCLETNKEKTTFGSYLGNSLLLGLDYCVSIILVGFVREILSYGTVFGKSLGSFAGLKFFSTLAGGLMIVIVFSTIYTLVALFINKRKQLYSRLVDRYTLVLTPEKPAVESAEKIETTNTPSDETDTNLTEEPKEAIDNE